ncbi:PH domain-containing protein [Vreelandella utahensis]|uniref:PH domain-containing protein n=1 Tax=Vreelandella halophila TaxID=86177 RepID=UPI000984ECA8|nr:PH domain-containing protein [Halomonas utahensis]
MTYRSDWHRVSPLAIIHHGLTFLRQLVGSNPGPLLGLIAGTVAFARESPLMIATTALTLVLLGVGMAVMGWLRFLYRVHDGAIQVQQGVFTRHKLTLAFERIQNVRLERPIYLRPFGLARLTIESAGSASEEVHLPGIPLGEAEGLRDRALAETNAPLEPEAEASGAGSPGTHELLRRDPSDLVIYGISSPAILWGGAIAASLMGAVTRNLGDDRSREAEQAMNTLLETMPGWLPEFLVLPLAILLLLVLMSLASMTMALLRYQGYQLFREGERYRVTSGLLTRREQGIRHQRIQHLHLAQSFVARLFRRHHLSCHPIGPSLPDQPDGGGGALMAPSLTPDEQAQIIETLYPGLDWGDLRFHPVNARFMLPRFAFWGLLATITVAWVTVGDVPAWVLALFLPVPPLIVLNWHRQGWCLHGERLILRGGLIGCHYTVFDAYRVQTLKLFQNPLQRRAGLANLGIRLGSGGFRLPFIPWGTGTRLMDHLLWQVETSRAPWL